MVELHSNFTFEGAKTSQDGMFPTNHQLHETIGLTESRGFVFSPNVKVSYDFTKKITGGFEYYGSVGPATDFDPIAQQQHQFFPAIDLNLSPKWEVNFGVGVGVTRSTEHVIAKMILGYRFNF